MSWKTPEERRAYREAHLEESRASCRAWYAAHREEKRIYMQAWHEQHKEEHRAYMRAYRVAYPERERAALRTYRESHQEKTQARLATWKAYGRTWRKTYPLKSAECGRRYYALKHGATIGPIDLEAIKVRDRMLCAICGKKVAEKDLSFDHSHPLSLGGPHSQENQRVAHRRCNERRGAGRLPVQMVLL